MLMVFADAPEVTELYKWHALAGHDERVLRLQVPVHDAFTVAVLQRDDQLPTQQA